MLEKGKGDHISGEGELLAKKATELKRKRDYVSESVGKRELGSSWNDFLPFFTWGVKL